MSLFRGLAVLLFLTCFILPSAAQVDRATLNGTVTDSSGAVVTNAKVEATSAATALRREVQTGANGSYLMPGLPIGPYTVTFSHEGFKTARYTDVELSVGQSRTLDAQLEVGALTTQVEVVAEAAEVNRTSAEIGGVIETQQVRNVPLNGRNWASLMLLAPGAINVGGGSQTSIRFVGRSRDDNNYTFDGIDASGVQESPQKSDVRLNISLDSIAEFRVNSAVYTAESGAGGGAQINVVSKSGTNQFHGSAFEFFRNDKLNARSPFDPSQLPPFHLNQFGANVGGPIKKDKTFFFANYEGIRQSLGQTLTGTVPGAALRAQVVAASSVLQPMIQAYPAPAGLTHLDANYDQFRVQSRNAVREDSGTVRIDHRFTDSTTMFARYTVDDGFIDSPSGPLGARDTIAIRPSNLVLGLLHVFSPTVINEAKTGMNRSAYVHPVVGVFPQLVSVPGFDDLPNSTLDEEIGTTFSWVDNLTIIRGRHTWKLGVDIKRVRLNNSGNALDSAAISYATLDDFIHNRLDSVAVDAALGIGGMRRTFWMGYGQDEIKVRSNLTLNLGVRYEYYSVMHEVKDRAAVVDLLGCGGFCPPGTPYYSPDRNNFAPRVGLAWSPARFKGKTVIRAGFGVYYGAGQNDDFSDPHESTASRLSLTADDVPSLSYPITRFLGQATTEGVAPKGIARDRRDLYYENWDFLVQQQLRHGFVGQVGYVASEGHKLFTNRPANLLDPVTKKRPFPTFGQFGVKRNDANNNFNALQASLQRRFTGGWLWQTQYMWSHAISDGSVGAGENIAVQNASCRACDRGDSAYDVRHTITINSIYQLPFGPGRRYLHAGGVAGKLIGGWEMSGLATASTGRPVNILVTRAAGDLPDGNRTNQRPDLAPGVSIYPSGGQTIYNWFNLAAFKVPAKGTWGNLGRNNARGPGLYEIDLGLEKRTAVTEHTSLSFRAEAFNLFNHPIYASPFNNVSAPARFGQITSVLNSGVAGTGTPRRLQFMLRLDF